MKNIIKITLFLLLLTQQLFSDILKENYITVDINGTNPKVILDFESDDLDQFILLDTNKNGLISWKELKDKKEEIINFVLPHLKISTDGKQCENNVTNFEVYRRVHQSYIKIDINLLCPTPQKETKVFYNLFFDVDKGQKAFFTFADKYDSSPLMLSSRNREIVVKIRHLSIFETFINFLIEGVWHIWIGFDHILFLLMLLIPSVIVYKNREFVPQASFKNTIIEILKIVTAFTIAHSITLALSVLGIVNVNTRYIEIAIALSVLFTALNNIFLFTTKNTWVLAFSFGLIHGFGFANVLKEMTLNSKELIGSLFGFNLGVEIGQMAIVLALIPLIYLTRKTKFYRYFILYGFSIVTAIISSLWAYERYFNLSILPF